MPGRTPGNTSGEIFQDVSENSAITFENQNPREIFQGFTEEISEGTYLMKEYLEELKNLLQVLLEYFFLKNSWRSAHE